MGKVVFWLVVIFGVLFALRLWNAAKARARSRAPKPAAAGAEAMVRCVRCGVFLPKPDARATADGYQCADPGCAVHRPR